MEGVPDLSNPTYADQTPIPSYDPTYPGRDTSYLPDLSVVETSNLTGPSWDEKADQRLGDTVESSNPHDADLSTKAYMDLQNVKNRLVALINACLLNTNRHIMRANVCELVLYLRALDQKYTKSMYMLRDTLGDVLCTVVTLPRKMHNLVMIMGILLRHHPNLNTYFFVNSIGASTYWMPCSLSHFP